MGSVGFVSWVNRLRARKADQQFSRDIQDNLALLFTGRAAIVVANRQADSNGIRSFDYATATVTTPDLYLRFTRVRGDFSIEVSLPCTPPKWEALDSILTWLDMTEGATKPGVLLPRWEYSSDLVDLDWRSIDCFLVTHWERLKSAASASGVMRKNKGA